MKKQIEKKPTPVKSVTVQDLKAYVADCQRDFTKKLTAKADAAGVKLDIRVLVEIQTVASSE